MEEWKKKAIIHQCVELIREEILPEFTNDRIRINAVGSIINCSIDMSNSEMSVFKGLGLDTECKAIIAKVESS